MLTLTGNAVTAVKSLTTQSSEKPDAGVRISGRDGGADQAPGLTLAPAEQPQPGDQVVEDDGA
ncbi:MAG: hypothetical protein ACRDRL_25300, partial [Sciscionella sp.]